METEKNENYDVITLLTLYIQRGTVGETIIHACLLRGLPVYILLAKRLLHVFPKLIVDFYVSDQYYGKLSSSNGLNVIDWFSCIFNMLVQVDPEIVQKTTPNKDKPLMVTSCYS